MNTLIDKFSRLMLWASMTDTNKMLDPEKVLPEEQEQALKWQRLIGGFVLMTAVLAFISGSYALHLVTDSTFFGIILGLFYACFILMIDRAIVGAPTKWMALSRLPLSVFIGFLVSTPLLLLLAENRIQEHIEENVRENNQELRRELVEETNQERINSEIDSLLIARDALADSVVKYGEEAECQLNHECVDDPPGAGPGPIYDEIVKNKERAEQQYQQTIERLNVLEARESEIHAEVDRRYREQKREKEGGLFVYLEALHQIISEDRWLWIAFWLIAGLICLMDAFPSITKLTNRTVYDAAIETDHICKLRLKRNEKREAKRKADCELAHNEQDIIADPWSFNVESFNQRHQRYTGGANVSSAGMGRNGAQQQQQNAQNGAHGPKTSHGQPHTSSGPNVSKPGNQKPLFSIILLLMAVLCVLELFTPVAPGQRIAGLAILYMPEWGFKAIMGKDTASNLKAVLEKDYSEYESKIQTREGFELTTKTSVNRVPTFFREALLVAENHRFERQFAVDWIRTFRALFDYIFVGEIRGTSSIVQQLARTKVLKNHDLTLSRKLKEFLIACVLRSKLDREQILQSYINSVYLANHIRGFELAARVYFGRSLEDLSRGEMISLMSLLPNPQGNYRDSDSFLLRYRQITYSLYRHGVISENEQGRLMNNVPEVNHNPALINKLNATRVASGYIRQHNHGQESLIRSTIDLEASTEAQNILKELVKDIRTKTGVENAAGFILKAEKGVLKSMVSTKPEALNAQTAWTPASTVKPFVYSQYLNGYGTLEDPLPVQEYTGDESVSREWIVQNPASGLENEHYVNAADALSASLNIPVAELATGPMGKDMPSALESTPLEDYFEPQKPGTFLGSDAIAPVEMFRALQAYVPPYGSIPEKFQLRINENVSQKTVWPSDVAKSIKDAMALTIDSPHGTLYNAAEELQWNGRIFSAKTGTAPNNRSATLFLTAPGGISLLIGVYGPYGEPLQRDDGSGIYGSSLAPYADKLFKNMPSIDYIPENDALVYY